MSAQTRYGFSTPIGSAGGIIDIAPYAIDTFLNDAENGTMKFGMGVVEGSVPGKSITVPTAGATADKFEGVTVNNRTTEYDIDGALSLHKNVSVGVMRYGRIYVRVAKDAQPTYGDAMYLIVDGDEAGYFTSDAGSNIAVKGRFMSSVDSTSGVAMAEIFNQAQV